MKILDMGHIYELQNGMQLIFMKKERGKLLYTGTTNEEILEILIDRLKHLQGKLPCKENNMVVTKLEECLMWLNSRTKKRVKEGVEGENKPHTS